MMDSTTPTTTAGKIAELRSRLEETLAPLGEEALREVRASGRLTARERVMTLLDEGSFVEIDALAKHRSKAFRADAETPVTDGVVAGHGSIDGRPVCIVSQDATLFDGRVGETSGEKILKLLNLAVKSGTPIVTLYDGLGARPREGVAALEMLSRIHRRQAQASGVIPQIAVVCGRTEGALAFGPALSDVIIEVADHGSLRLADEIFASEADEPGSTELDARSGTAHIVVPDDSAALDVCADILAALPSNNRALAPDADAVAPRDLDVDHLVPDDTTVAYDMRDVLDGVLDEDSFIELQAHFAPNLIAGFARIEGRSVGVLANQPLERAGGIDVDAAEKASRFIRLCDVFSVPVVSFIDTPGFLPDSDGDLLRRATKLINAIADASIGQLAVVTRKSYGSAFLALGSKRLGTDLVFAWPTAEISPGPAEELARAVTKGRAKDVTKIQDKLLTPYAAAERGLVDAVIPPSQTRTMLSDGLRLLERKLEDALDRKHNNMPL